jgi:hypothetical protein
MNINYKFLDTNGEYFLYSKDSETIFQLQIDKKGDRIFFSPNKQKDLISFCLEDFKEHTNPKQNYRICYFSDEHLGGLAIKINKILKNKNNDKKQKMINFFYKNLPTTRKIHNELRALKLKEIRIFNEERIIFD